MATWRTVCELASELPEAEIGERFGAPVWRVRGKVIVQLNPRMRIPEEAEVRARNGDLIALHVRYDERAALLHEQPDTFVVTPHYQNAPEVLVWLRRVKRRQLAELLQEAWRLRMPKTARRALGFGA